MSLIDSRDGHGVERGVDVAFRVTPDAPDDGTAADAELGADPRVEGVKKTREAVVLEPGSTQPWGFNGTSPFQHRSDHIQ